MEEVEFVVREKRAKSFRKKSGIGEYSNNKN